MTEGNEPDAVEGAGTASPEASIDSHSGAVFISYASADSGVADAIVASLEGRGVGCWIAPRDVRAGALYAEAIVRAITDARALVLVLSANSVASAHVGKEVERASSKRRPVIAMRIDEAPLSPALEYFLSESHWVDARAGGMDAALAKLIVAIREPERGAPGNITVGAPAKSAGLASAPPPKLRRNRILVVAGIAVLAVAIAVLIADRFWRAKHVVSEQSTTVATNVVSDKSIAVLPFTDMSEKHDQEYFAEGLSEEIIDVLSGVPDLRVIGHGSAFKFKGRSEDLGAVGTQLGAAHIVQGSVRRSGDHVRVTAQLIRASDGALEWSSSYDRDVSDLLQVQSEIAMALGRALELSVPNLRENQGTVLPEAYDVYLRGLHSIDKYSRDGFEEADSYLQRAIELDPRFVRAYEELAGVHLRQVADGYVPPDAGFAQIRDDATRLLRLAPRSPWGPALLCRYNISYSWNFSEAGRECADALALSPHDSVVMYEAAELALVIGENEKSAQLFRAALVLDPLNADILVELSQPLLRLGRLAEAEAELRRGLAISPTFDGAHYWLGTSLMAEGRLEDARREFELESPEGGREAGLAMVYHALGRDSESKAVLERFTREHAKDSAFIVAEVYGYLGDVGDAFEWLERAYRQKDAELQYVKGDWPLRNIEHDSRYKTFLRKMNLPE